MTLREKIDFEENWLLGCNLTSENVKIAFSGIRASLIESQPKWIPVTEELPKTDQYVLVLVNPAIEKEHPIIISSREKGKEKYWTDGTILAWMPLPPFKGVEKCS